MAVGITFRGKGNVLGGWQSLSRAMIREAQPTLVAAGNATVEEAQTNIINIIGRTYGQRQGKARSEPLATRENYQGEIDLRPAGILITFKVGGSSEWKRKFGALNYGAGPHVISGAKLGNPADTSQKAKGFFAKGSVIWYSTSGKFGTRFYEQGVDEALRAFRTHL